MRKKRLLSFLMVLVLMLTQVGVLPVFANELPKAPINLLKAVEKNQFLIDEEFTINYKIQSQPIQADKILPESYLKDKEIVLVMDTSGSMKEEIRYNQENDHQSIFQEKYATKNVSVNLRDNHNGQDIYDYTIQFTEPSAGENVDTRYLIFYSEREIDVVGNWIKNLNSSNLKYLYNDSDRALGISSDNSKYRSLPDWLSDIEGYSFSGNKYYNVYVATINDLNNGKVIGLTKAKNTIGRTTNKKPKIDVMKEVAKNFLEKLKDDNNSGVKVALVPYASYAQDNNFNNKDFAKLSDFTQYKSLTDKIEALSADGGTNIGDGLRKAFYKFSDSDEDTRRYVILMTDGEPTFHSFIKKWKWEGSGRRRHKKWYKELYFGDGSYPNNYDYEGGGHYATEDDKLYANKAAEDLILKGGKEIESFMIAFSNDADKSELKNIANSANGYYKEAVDGNALDEVYQKLAEQIQSDLPIHGINFQETFPQGINIVEVSEGLEFNGQTVTGDIGSISYILNEESNQFEAEPFEFFIKLKGTEIGDYNLGEENTDNITSYIDYKDIDGTDGHKAFPGVDISVYENKPPEITASLSQHGTDEDKYKLSLIIDEPSKIEILNSDGERLWYKNKTGESPNNYPKTFSVQLDKADLKGNLINIKAEDKSRNKAEETVPLINLKPIEILGWNENDKTIKGILDLQTELNSTITSVKINGDIVAENRLLTEEGTYSQRVDFKEGSNSIDITVENQFKNISTETVIKVIEKYAIAPEVNIKVSDASGLRDTYDVSSQNEDKRVDEILDPSITLKGDAFANINVKGKDVDFFKYQFLNSSETPSHMPITGWESIDLNEETVNEDVVTEKRGFLNQRSFDVSHMPLLNDTTKWSDSEEVFKDPFDATTYKEAIYSSSPQQYGKLEDYIKSDGTNGKRWVTNSVFIEKMSIGGQYKESSKFWGYIKVDETGDYKFGAHSDDGCRGYITVNGETKAFVDMFKPQGRNKNIGTTNNVYSLEEGKYYPIYLEYFNWGGSAAFEIKYSDNNGSSWKRVPQNYFYPSKNITPGEYATSIFTGSKGVKFPSESGDYYIAFRTGKGTDITREGIYGPFTVNGKSTINVSKVVKGGNIVNEKNKFILEYTINPADIEPRSTFKENGELKQKIFLNNVQLQDEYPNSIEIKTGPNQSNIVKNGQKITVQIKKIEYNLITKNGQKIYSAEPIKIQVYLSAKELGDYTLSETGKSIITFTDVNEANRQIEFEPVNITVKHQLRENLKVLEVQPTLNFELEPSMFTSIAKEDGIDLTQMSMPQFISDIDKINGNYDVVYIGSKNGSYAHIGSRPNKLPYNNSKDNGTDSLEYYSENDITNRKADDLKEFVDSGQLTIFSNSVFEDNETKLHSNFNSYIGNKSNFITTDDIVEKIKSISKLYEDCNKRPILSITESPIDFLGTIDNDSTTTSNFYEDTKNMNFVFDINNINVTGNNENLMNVRLYLDKNGDGFFREDEIVEEHESKPNRRGYVLNYRLEEYFTGMMPWKLEIEDIKTGSKAYKTGYPAYKGDKLEVRVLQLIPPRNTFDISDDMKVPLSTDYYNVEVTTLRTDDFNDNYPNNIGDIKTELNGNYDMIILGFDDGFENGDLTIEAIEAIKEFIKTGQSVMFTHDTMSYHVNNYGAQCENLTEQFRDIIGQSRYNNNSIKNNDRISYNNDEFYLNEIVHDALPDATKASYGFTKGILDVKNGITPSHPHINKTYKLNEGLFTRYPYNLANNPQKQLNVATTHEQYFQLNLEDEDVIPWFTLDGEGSNSYIYDKYDGRNNYYTYTKGNITYSGTGHVNPDGNGSKKDEHEMFMNTIIKASRSANHAPTLEVTNLEENKKISKSQEKFEFSFIARDLDGDPLSGKVYINGNSVISYDEGDIKNGEQVNVEIYQGILDEYVGDNNEFTIRIVVEDPKGAIAEEIYLLRYLNNPIYMTIDEKRGYLVGETASFKLKVIADRFSDDFKTKTNNIDFSMEYDNDALKVVGDSNWEELSNITFNPDPQPQLQKKTFEFKLEQEGNYSVENIITFDYSNISVDKQEVEYSYPINVRSGMIDIEVVNSDGTAFESVKVEVEKPDGSIKDYHTNDKRITTLSNQLPGSYKFTIKDLPDKYMVKGGNFKTFELSYGNNIQKAKFELIDKSKIGLDLISESKNGYLVGDTAEITLTAIAHNDDENIRTRFRNIEYWMSRDINDALELIPNESWNIRDIDVDGKTITYDNPPNNNPPSTVLSFKVNNKPDDDKPITITNHLKYEYLSGNRDVRSDTHEIRVRSGKIRVEVVNSDSTVKVTVTRPDGSTEDYETDEDGIITLSDQPSGIYTFTLKDLDENLIVKDENLKTIDLKYEKYDQVATFELLNSTTIINNGMYINNKFVETDEVVTGFDAHLAAKFKVLDKEPEIKLILDKEFSIAQLKLFKVDNSGNLTVDYGNIGFVEIKGESIEGKKTFEIVIPELADGYNSYLLQYTVSQKAEVDDELEYNIDVNGIEGDEGQLTVVALPILD
ncbi:DUF5057 domain-containing protein [Oceanirhabdus seepicola]|uniref:DUF5057 domain-containing protein n=1 Tax=Oceanirhabdus seepicola TaxID=2828781 RepID=A0A9J6P5U8_9CLOT|nr:DUF5057 domain-containing protein [Oceanirhabdus seepicola]MCM1990848.1 DUF5057 domain-containing protein [Oceanirhabdus seepicola]